MQQYVLVLEESAICPQQGKDVLFSKNKLSLTLWRATYIEKKESENSHQRREENILLSA